MVPGHCSTDSLPKDVSSCTSCLFAVFAAETNYSLIIVHMITIFYDHMKCRRRLHTLHLMRGLTLLRLQSSSSWQRRRFWIRPRRTNAWWMSMKLGLTVEEEWKENFRMLKESFYKLTDKLRPFIKDKKLKWGLLFQQICNWQLHFIICLMKDVFVELPMLLDCHAHVFQR